MGRMRFLFEPLIRAYFQKWMIVYPDDVYIVSYPRSGNRWMRFLLACMLYPGDDDILNDLSTVFPDQYDRRRHLCLWRYQRPRIIKSHEPFTSRYPAVIYLYRDGRDVCLSYWDWYCRFEGRTFDFQEFFDLFMKGRVSYGTWSDHVESWLFRTHSIPLLPIKYEDMFANTGRQLRRVADFLKKDVSDDRIQQAVDRSVKDRQSKTGLYAGKAKGGSGKWKDVFTADNEKVFWERAGIAMEKLGYEK